MASQHSSASRAAAARHSWRRRENKRPPSPRIPRSPKTTARSHGRRPYPDWLVHAQVERRRYDDVDVERFIRDGKPVVLTDVPITRPLIGKWDLDYLAKHYDGPKGLNVHFAPRSTTRFSRFYGEGAGEGGIVGMSFPQFVATVRRNERTQPPPWRHYMQSTLLWGRGKVKCKEIDPKEITGSFRAASEEVDHAHYGKQIIDDLRQLDWAWLERMCAIGGCDGLTETNLWAGVSGGCTPLHYDSTSNFLCQVCGRKRLLLFEPGSRF